MGSGELAAVGYDATVQKGWSHGRTCFYKGQSGLQNYNLFTKPRDEKFCTSLEGFQLQMNPCRGKICKKKIP